MPTPALSTSAAMIKFCPNDGSMLMGEWVAAREGRGSAPVPLSLDLRMLASHLPLSSTPFSAVGPDRRPETTRDDGLLFFYCEACPYAFPITTPVVQAAPVRRKPLDDILGGDEAWAHVQKADTRCPACAHGVAYFYEVQTRSADEPATLFFRCVECGHQWRESP